MESDKVIFVLFGGTGDLVKNKLAPALALLSQEETIAPDSTIIGIARGAYTDESYRDFLVSSLPEHRKEALNSSSVRFFRGDVSQPNSLTGLKDLLRQIDPSNTQPVFYYLATSYALFPSIVDQLHQQGIAWGKKIVFEKPFGSDYASSQELNEHIHKVFPEKDVFRVDHYLGKQTVQQILELRRKKEFESKLSAVHAERINIIADEDFGVESRIRYYNEAGALKDMVQNHLLQVLSLLLMNHPSESNPDAIHDEKVRVLKGIHVLPPHVHLLGQYEGYGEEAEKFGIRNSAIDTFAKIGVESEQERWKNVPIFLRAGKNMPKKKTEFIVHFKDIPHVHDNTLTFDLALPRGARDEYSVLLGDLVRGDKRFFPRFDEIQESWRIIHDFEKIKKDVPFVTYRKRQDPETVGM
ncbi:hypothetical protein KW805_00605 [Candidatus Pacearchaeota archaeon]|nr:hypothetical protein [Candidatus Pacearchaeota archaeon]